MGVDDLHARNDLEQSRQRRDVGESRLTVWLDPVEHDAVDVFEPLPDRGLARTGDVDLECVLRQPLDEFDNVRRHPAVQRLSGDQKSAGRHRVKGIVRNPRSSQTEGVRGRDVDLNELLQVLWRRRISVLVVAAITIGVAIGVLRIVTPVYESSATLALTPEDISGSNQLIFFGTLDAIVPVYADAAVSRTTRDLARRRLGRSLASVTVDTFKGTGLLKIKSRNTSRYLARDTVQSVTNSLLERTTTGGVGIKSLRLVELDNASLPTSPVFPRKKLTLIVAGLLGVVLGIGVALLRENLTTKVETSEDLARIAGVPSFADIPREASVTRIYSPEQLASELPLRGFAEALRDLRTNLLFSEGNVRSLVVTSPEGSHGKTTVAFGLAMTLARAGTRTVLVDADLRRGRISELMAITRSPGLMEVLLKEAPLEEVIRSTSLPQLSVLTGGRRVGDPTE